MTTKSTGKKKQNHATKVDPLVNLICAIDSCATDFGSLSKALAGPAKKTSNYLEYCQLNLADEDSLIKPKVARRFLTDVLGFTDSDFIPEKRNINNRRPDYTPEDKLLHPFAFEIKGMDSDESDLHDEWVNKSSLYLEDDRSLRFVIITNMREVRVYGADSGSNDRFDLLNNLCFDIPDVYRWAKLQEDDESLETPAFVSAFRSFCNIFSNKNGTLSIDQKLEEIFQAPPERPRKQSEKEKEAEKKQIREDLFAIINSFVDDLKTNQKVELQNLWRRDSDSRKQLEQEIGEIQCSLAGKVSNFVSESDLIEKGKETLTQYFDEGLLFSDEMDLFYRRVAYFTVFKLLLIRSWEDAEFISRDEWHLYDGGFYRWYNQSNKNIKRVLESAYGIAKNRYEWLFKDNNNYSWYYPTSDFAIDALWRLSKHNFSVLNNDVLGSIYEEHLNLSAKKKVGLFYTHPKVVSLMWDVAGYVEEDEIFETSVSGKKVERSLKRILEPCMGSGSFLCEAIRRILDAAGVYNGKHGDIRALRELKEQILGAIRGVELDQFAFFIAEINVLLMLTPLVKLIEDKGRGGGSKEMFATGLIPHDSLYFYRNDEPGWKLTEPSQAIAREKDYKNSSSPLISGRKRDVARELLLGMTNDSNLGYDFCTSNPPYVGEKEAKDLFDSVKSANPHLQDLYQGKMDYLYWFILLGLSKLKPGGKLCYITTAYWPTAEGAAKLRATILENGILRTIIDFGEQKLFEHAPGQHNLVFIIEKSDLKHTDFKKWSEQRTKVIEVKVGSKVEAKNHEERIGQLVRRIADGATKDAFEDDLIRVYFSGKSHGDMLTRSWNLKCTTDEVDLIARLHLNNSSLEQEFCSPKTGIQPGALTVTPKLKKKFFSSNPKVRIGEGIFTLTPEEARGLGAEGKKFLKPLTKSSDILSFSCKPKGDLFLVYTHKDNSPEGTRVLDHLKRFKPVLESKRETKAGKLPWWSNHWPRDPETFESHNLVIPYRAIWNNFAAVSGPSYGLTEVYFVPDKSLERLKALEAILNSDLAHFWFAIEGKHKGSQIELLDFGHFPVPKLEKEMIKRLCSVSDLCRDTFSKIIALGVCPRTAIHFGVESSLFDPISYLGKQPATLKRFQTAGLLIEGMTDNESATLKSIAVKDATAVLKFTGRKSNVTISKGRLSTSDFAMITNWIQRYGKDMSWQTIYTDLAFPKDAKTLASLELSFMRELKNSIEKAKKAYFNLNEAVAEAYQLTAQDRRIIKNRIALRVEALRSIGLDAVDDDSGAEEEIA